MVDVVRASEQSDRPRTDSPRAPFYDDGFVHVWHGDARALPVADESVNLIITSPPYNCRVAYDGYDDWLTWNEYWHGLIEPSMRERFRVLAPGGRLAVNLANVVRQDVNSEHFKSSRGQTGDGNRQARMGKHGPSRPLLGAHGALQVIPCCAPSRSRCLLRARSRMRGPQEYPTSRRPNSRRGRETFGTSPWETSERDLDHPCNFPPELPRRLIKLYSYVGDVVLDPFCGSGTTLRVAKDLARRAIGVDISRRYCAMSADRCRQQLLFAVDLHAPEPTDVRT